MIKSKKEKEFIEQTGMYMPLICNVHEAPEIWAKVAEYWKRYAQWLENKCQK